MHITCDMLCPYHMHRTRTSVHAYGRRAHAQLEPDELLVLEVRGQRDAGQQLGRIGEGPPLGAAVFAPARRPQPHLALARRRALAAVEERAVRAAELRRHAAAGEAAVGEGVLPAVARAREQCAQSAHFQRDLPR